MRHTRAVALTAVLLVLLVGVGVLLPPDQATPLASDERSPDLTGKPHNAPAEHALQRQERALQPTSPDTSLHSAVVRCPLTAPVPVQGDVEFVLTLSETSDASRHVWTGAKLTKDAVDLNVIGGSARKGKLTVPGYLPVDVSWENAVNGSFCAPIQLKQAAIITGRVHPPDGRIYVRGCDGFSRVDDDGEFYLEAETGQLCEFTAERMDEPFVTYSEPVLVETSLAAEAVVELTLPSARTTGLGVAVTPHEHGLWVTGVRTGSAAGALNIRKGSILVVFNGEHLAGLTTKDFHELEAGLEGSRFEIRVMDGIAERTTVGTRLHYGPSTHMVDRCDEESGCGSFREPKPGAWVE